MPTKQQLESALINAHKAGDTKAAKALANAIKAGKYDQEQPQETQPEAIAEPVAQPETVEQAPTGRMRGMPRMQRERRQQREAALEQLRRDNPYLAEAIEDMGPLDAFLVGAGRGMTTVGRGLGIADPETDIERQAFDALQTQRPDATGAGELIGETAPFLAVGGPLAGAARTTATKALATGTTGALEGGVLTKGKGGSTGEIVLGAALGGALGGSAELALPAISSAGRKVYNRITGKTDSPIGADGNITPEAAEQLQNSGIEIDEFVRETVEDADIGNDQRRAIFESLGLEPTRAQVTRDKDLFGQQVEADRKSGLVSDALDRQSEILNQAAKAEARSIGGVGHMASTNTSDAIIDKAVQLDEEINELYIQARERAPDAKNVKFNRAAAVVRQNAASNDASGGIVAALRGQMDMMGVTRDFKASGRVNVKQAEELRKHANRLHKSATPEGKFIIGKFKDALDEDTLKASGEDLFKSARNAKAEFEKGLSSESKSKFGKDNKSLVRAILEEGILEDKIADQIINKGSSYGAKSIKELKDYLLSGTDGQVAQGLQAWNDIRSNAFERIMSGAFRGAVDKQGNARLSKAGLSQAIRTIGPKKLEMLFTKSERNFLTRLSQVAALSEAPPSVKSSPSGPAIERLRTAIIQGMQRVPGFKIIGTEIEQAVDRAVSNTQNKKLLQRMATDLELAEKEANKLFAQKVRASKVGTLAATAAPAAGVAAATDEVEE